jgi:tetratricopeptide (TPR) repeat protein
MRFRLALGLLASVSLAHADRRTAEQFAREAKDTQDHTKYVACGQAYLDLYNQDPKAPEADENLYNAGVCFQEGYSIGLAITMFDTMTREFPRSKMAPRVIARTGHLHSILGSYAKAAELYEQYARKYGGEKDAYQALSDAAMYRGALGDDAKQIENVKLFVKQYGAKKPVEAGQAMASITEAIGRRSAEDKEKHLREILRAYGKDPELAIRSYVALGESLWQRACPVKPIDGLCLKVERDRALPMAPRKAKPNAASKRCSPTSTIMITVPRNAKLVEEAMRALGEVEKLATRMVMKPTPATTYYVARAKLLIADRQAEDYAAVRFPTNLSFSPDRPQQAKASTAKFQDFLQQRQKLGSAANNEYTAVLGIKDALNSITATQRIGFISQSLGTELMSAEIPRDVRTGEFAADKIEAFCDKMIEVAEPLLQRAIQAYDVCLTKASELGVDDASVRACARERAALGPSTFALTTEMVPELPLPLPTFDEEPLRKSRHLPNGLKEIVEEFWAVYSPVQIPDAKCAPLARKFEVFGTADAWFMAGLTYGRCNQAAKAKAAYTTALAIDPKHGKAMSNLAELELRAGNHDLAKKQWEQALAINAKLFGASLGLASLSLRELRALPATAPNRKQVTETAERYAMSAAAMANLSRPEPYYQLALIALERNRLPLAKALSQEAQKLDVSPHTDLLRAYLAARGTGGTLQILETAATSSWTLEETQLALGLQHLTLRRYQDAVVALAKVKRPGYDVLIARGIAARGLGKWADAEARYTEALKLDPSRPEASFNLGVLWKDYTAARATDPAAAKTAFKKAADAFRRVGTPEAKLYADDCDKAAALL